MPLQHETSRGQLVNLLRVAGEPSVDTAVRQVASITFKQAAKRHWEPEKEGEVFRDVFAQGLVLPGLLL